MKILLLLRTWMLIYCQERNEFFFYFFLFNVRVLRHCNPFSRISISNWFNFLILYNVRNVELNSHPVIDFWVFFFLFLSVSILVITFSSSFLPFIVLSIFVFLSSLFFFSSFDFHMHGICKWKCKREFDLNL